jgi:tRNA A-37 threonylcarbamoyl transferase component Bud32
VYAAACTLHEAHVIHNDLEPRNVLVDKEDEVHLIDFHVSQIDHECGGPGKCEELDYLAARLGL